MLVSIDLACPHEEGDLFHLPNLLSSQQSSVLKLITRYRSTNYKLPIAVASLPQYVLPHAGVLSAADDGSAPVKRASQESWPGLTVYPNDTKD